MWLKTAFRQLGNQSFELLGSRLPSRKIRCLRYDTWCATGEVWGDRRFEIIDERISEAAVM
jgi:hypothetical protein